MAHVEILWFSLQPRCSGKFCQRRTGRGMGRTGCVDQNYPKLKLTAKAPETRPGPKRKLIFQPSIFRFENANFREGTCLLGIPINKPFATVTGWGVDPRYMLVSGSVRVLKNTHQAQGFSIAVSSSPGYGDKKTTANVI